MSESRNKIRIMIVDDEKIITMHMDELLTSMGYDVVGIASSGEEAIEKAEKLLPDIILMDIIMSGVKNGIEAANEIKQKHDIPIIFLTAFADDKLVEKAKISEPYSYLIKPFQGQELKAAIEIAIYKKELDRKLKESEEKYRTLIEESRDGIGIIQDGILKYVNPALFEMLGNPIRTDNKPIASFMAEGYNEVARSIFSNNQNWGQNGINELIISRNDGSTVPVEVSLSKITFNGESATISVFRNITERKYAEDLFDCLVQEINESNQLMIPNIEEIILSSHDEKQTRQLKQVLNLLFENSNTIKKAYKLLQLINNSSVLKPIDIIDTLKHIVKLVVNQFPERIIDINTHIEGNVPEILADEFIEDILLLAFDASMGISRKSSIKLEVIIKKEQLNNQDFVVIRIENRCEGINDFEIEKILNYTKVPRKDIGSDIGLNVISTAFKRYSGHIDINDLVEGDNTKGIVFVLRLPAVE